MPRKTLIAMLVALAGAVPAAPASAACVPPYCPAALTHVLQVGLSANTKAVTQTLLQEKTKFIQTKIYCALTPGCKGKFVLTALGAKSSRAHTSSVTVYGSVDYSLKYGETAEIKIPLNAAGQKALERTGTLNTAVVAVSKGVRTVVAKLKVKSTAKHKKKSNHFTRARVKPGFTG